MKTLDPARPAAQEAHYLEDRAHQPGGDGHRRGPYQCHSLALETNLQEIGTAFAFPCIE